VFTPTNFAVHVDEGPPELPRVNRRIMLDEVRGERRAREIPTKCTEMPASRCQNAERRTTASTILPASGVTKRNGS